MRSDGAKLRGWCDLCDAAAEMAEVLRTHLETQDLFDDGREVRQRADDAERRRIGGARQAPRGSEISAFSTASSGTPRWCSWAASRRSWRRTAPHVPGVVR